MADRKRNKVAWILGLYAFSICQCALTHAPVLASDQPEYRWGFIDKTGKMVMEPQFEDAGPFSQGLAMVQKKVDGNWRYGFINPEGKTVIDFEYEDAGTFSEGLAPVRIPDNSPLLEKLGQSASRKWGYIDLTGKLIIEPKFDNAKTFSDGLAPVADGIKYGYVDRTGNWVIKPNYDMACPFVNGRAAVMTSDGTGFLSIQSQSDIYKVQGGKWTYINKKGEVAFGSFESCGIFYDGISPVALGPNQGKSVPDKWGFVDTNGKFVIKPRFNNVHALSEGMAAAQTGTWKNMGSGIKSWIPGKWGFINSKGKQVIESKFDAADPFSNGMASVRINDKWGYIDTTGNVVIEPQFNGSWGFSENLAPVQVSVVPKSETTTEKETEEETN